MRINPFVSYNLMIISYFALSFYFRRIFKRILSKYLKNYHRSFLTILIEVSLDFSVEFSLEVLDFLAQDFAQEEVGQA